LKYRISKNWEIPVDKNITTSLNVIFLYQKEAASYQIFLSIGIHSRFIKLFELLFFPVISNFEMQKWQE
jgi:hypothetical protein